MLAVERRKKIVDIITENKSVLVLELAKEFDVTGETIRGDLEKLEQQGILVRTYGGATLVEKNDVEMTYQERETKNYEGKHAIGLRAAEYIEDGDTIFLDASTSSFHVALSIKDKKRVTVITNSERVILELAGCKDINVICTGGTIRPKSMSYVGRLAEKNIYDNYYANKCFFSCRGVNLSRGLMDSHELEAEIKRAMIRCSETVFFLCDQSKLGVLGVPVICNMKDIHYCITDVKFDERWKEEMENNEVEIVVATK